MKRSFNIVLVLFSAFMFFSCGSTKKIAPKAELFSNVWVDNSKMSAQDCGKFYTSPELGRFSSIEVEFKKTSGSETGTFGLVFDYSSQKDGICSDYIRFEINTLGEYAIYSFDGNIKILWILVWKGRRIFQSLLQLFRDFLRLIRSKLIFRTEHTVSS